MTDKTKEFERINNPRIEKIMHMIGLVEKSAASMRLPEAGATALQRVADYLKPQQIAQPGPVIRTGPTVEGMRTEVVQTANGPGLQMATTPPVAREMEALGSLSTQQLVDRMIACGAELAKRRK